ncbi:hypothetical protein LUZ61_020856 [Rhynchospora tenuis]|uniref:Uncharacterized protein n=1 Tax=Rhynchospora tenuis TaxID=198213 RepID=A0AAD5ZE40_9POAL|nr:hypothetical protein LUZ61_020856 [Rhynchospora tenuis]
MQTANQYFYNDDNKSFVIAGVESIGVCYGNNGKDLPSPSEVATLYQKYGIHAMRLYSPDPNILNAFKNTGIEVMVDVPNELLGQLADSSAAAKWVHDNILAYLPGISFKYIAVGNEMDDKYANCILPAMSKIYDAICSAGLKGKIMVSTAVRFDVFTNTSPPKNAVFSKPYMEPIINFLANTGAPLLVNVYPYFSYQDNSHQIPLDYALFTSTKPNQDGYQNLFDAMVDSVYYAIEKTGHSQVGVVVSESGWPSYGGVDTTQGNAQMYNQNLIKHVPKGTPKKPWNLETYIFAMFNENGKSGAEVERHFGLFYPNQSPVYAISFN